MAIGEAARLARERAGYTVCELAKRARVTHATISTIEHDRRNPSVATVIAICDVLGISLDEYCGREVEEND